MTPPTATVDRSPRASKSAHHLRGDERLVGCD